MTGFTYADYANILRAAREYGYKVMTVRDFFEGRANESSKVLISRLDVDVKIERVPIIANLYKQAGFTASFYLRLHAAAYNVLSMGNIAIVRQLIADGFEVGLHTELVDANGINGIDSRDLLVRELELFATVFGAQVCGTASHGDMTPYNNLDFWKKNKPSDFGLLYEAYDSALWLNARYVSDSEWTRWKAYEKGQLLEGDRGTPIDHMREGVPRLYLLTHPESWYYRYIYE